MTIPTLLGATLLSLSLQATPDPLVGQYTLDATRGDDLSEVVEEIVKDVNRFARGRARGRLAEAMAPPTTLEIAMDGGAYLLVVNDREPMRLVPGAPAHEAMSPDGDRVRVSADLEGSSLVLRFDAERGGRTQTFTPTEDGLEIETLYELEIRDEPVRVRAVYRRAAL